MPRRNAFIVFYACSGAAGLIYEVVWTRRLTLELGHTTAATGTVLAAFMGGLAIGALVGGAIVHAMGRRRALQAYAALELGVALSALALPTALNAAVPLLARAYGEEPGVLFEMVRLACCLALVFGPAAAMGATFPLAIQRVADESTPGLASGRRSLCSQYRRRRRRRARCRVPPDSSDRAPCHDARRGCAQRRGGRRRLAHFPTPDSRGVSATREAAAVSHPHRPPAVVLRRWTCRIRVGWRWPSSRCRASRHSSTK